MLSQHRAAILAVAALCILSLAAGANAQPKQWVSHGPGGGGAMYSPSINPNNPDEIFIACDMSPEFHSKDYGKTWETLNFTQFTSNHFSAVRFTKDAKVMWSLDYTQPAGTEACRPMRSADGGKTWTKIPESSWPISRKAYIICNDFANPDRVYISAEYSELWVTLDGGKTFEQKYKTTSKNGLVLGGVFCDGDTVYFGTSDGLLISKDGGKTIAKSDIGGMGSGEGILYMAGAKTGDKVRLFAVAYDKLWAGILGQDFAGYKGVYVLDVGQKEWVKKTSGIEAGVPPFYVACAANDIDTCYLGGPGPSVYKTTDGGEKWEQVFLTKGNKNIVTAWAGDGGDFRWSYPEYCLGMDVCPANKDRVVITDLGCAHATADGGKTWQAIYAYPTKPHEMGKPTPKGDSYKGNGIEPTSAWWICWMDEKNLTAGYTDIRGMRSTDGGESWGWNYTGHALNSMYHVIKHPTKDLGFLANSSIHDMYHSTYLADSKIDRGKGSVMYTTDKGANWKMMKDFAHPVIWVAIDPKNPNRMMACVINSKDGGIYLTEDADKLEKAEWTKLATPPHTEGHPMNAYFLDDGNLVSSFSGRRTNQFTPSSGVFLSTDNGKTWEDRSDPALKCWTRELVIDPNDKAQNTWYASTFMAWGNVDAAAKRSGLYRTTDRGKTWTNTADKAVAPSTVLNVSSCTVSPIDPNVMYFTTEYDGLYYTKNLKDAKPTFKQVENFPFRNATRVFYNPFKKGEVWVCTFGNGMYVGQE